MIVVGSPGSGDFIEMDDDMDGMDQGHPDMDGMDGYGDESPGMVRYNFAPT